MVNPQRVSRVFTHMFLLTPYVKNEIHGPNYMWPSAELTEHEGEEWEVECIVGHRKRGRSNKYHMLWKGYPITEATWEPESVFDHVQETLQPYKEYHRLNMKIWTLQCLFNEFSAISNPLLLFKPWCHHSRNLPILYHFNRFGRHGSQAQWFWPKFVHRPTSHRVWPTSKKNGKMVVIWC